MEQGFSQEGFADACCLHRTYISGIERGVRNPTLKVPAGQLLDEIRAPFSRGA